MICKLIDKTSLRLLTVHIGISFTEPAIKTPLLGFFSSAQTSTPATQPVITHVKEEEAKDDNDGEEDDTEKDEKKTYALTCSLHLLEIFALPLEK